MILRLALRSLTTRPLRSAVLAAGFGLGISVMVELLGVGEVILEQAHSPALQGGGDVMIASAVGPLESARFVLSHLIGSARFHSRVRAASPSRRTMVYLIGKGGALPIAMTGGVPSLERAVGDPEIAHQPAWHDEPADAAWTNLNPGDILRAMDRFHPMPSPQPPATGAQTWAEWLYFNGRSADGRLRFYLSFIARGPDAAGKRPLIVHLQLDRDGRSASYTAVGEVDDRDLIARAPDLDVAGNHVRLAGTRYEIALALASDVAQASRPAVTGTIALDALPGRSLPPAAIHGAGGWVSGYVVPVLAGTFHGTLTIDGVPLSIENVAGYHDHNWGFWEGVHWQWGQVANRDLSIVYGRVFPPSTVADANRVPGFLGVLGPDGPIGFSSNVSIEEQDDRGSPNAITVHARGEQLELTMRFTVGEMEKTSTFLQLGGVYQVSGRAGDREISFTARGSAETFRLNPDH
jgi:hypothetical protein